MMNEQIEASYQWCKSLCRNSGSSFCWSFRLLTRESCLGMYALYAFARITDDLADDTASFVPRTQNLQAWSQQLRSLVANMGGQPWLDLDRPEALIEFDSLWPALQHTLSTFAIPIGLLEDIVKGVSMDIEHRQPQDWGELDNYCYHVASAVGIACTHIWRAGSDMPRQYAVDCGIAFQLTNILRDIADDASQGRIYIPHDQFERFDVSPVHWLQGYPTGQWKKMVQEISDRAEMLYREGWKVKRFLPPQSQRVFSLMWRYYHELLQQATRNPEKLWSRRRLKVPSVTRVRLAAQHFIPPLYWTLPSPSMR
jgi:15-cis-phytoene synthase